MAFTNALLNCYMLYLHVTSYIIKQGRKSRVGQGERVQNVEGDGNTSCPPKCGAYML